MTFWRTFHSVNEDLAFVCGFSLNILLLIVIKKIKVKTLQKYNILLFQCCCVDMFQVISSFIVKPAVVYHQRSLYLLSDGLLRPIGRRIEMIGICIWTTSVCFCICSMPVSYIFRYRVVCLNAEISKKFYITSLIMAFLSASTYGIYTWRFQYLNNQHLTYLAEESFGWLMADDEGKVKAASICPVGSLCIYLDLLFLIVLGTVPYAIMIFCKIKISNHMKYNQQSFSIVSRRAQRDLNMILTAQAVIPILFVFLPGTVNILCIITDFDLVFASFICGILYCWIPVGNAISVLFFVTAYRTKFKQLFLRVKPKLSRFKSVPATVGTNTQLQLSVANTNT